MMDEEIVSVGYDAVYKAMPKSPTLRRLWREHACGLDFPEEFAHISFVTLPELRRIETELRLTPDDTFVDLGCGMAGPALWMARETGARLTGVDLSAVAVSLAGERAASLGLGDAPEFRVGSFASTGLPDGSADAAMSEDALQYAPDKRAAMAEAARVLRPGARFVFTAFELAPERVRDLPVIGADPVDDYRPVLDDAGFSIDAYDEIPGWPEPMTAAYSALVAADEALRAEMGDLAVNALFGEITMTLEQRPYRRRVLAVATRR
ncbi:MAG: methyltransferase domain-containing protein [Dehalococcoidia bacterium]